MCVCVRLCLYVCLSLRSHSWLRDTARRCAITDTVTAEDTDTTVGTTSATVTAFTDTDTDPATATKLLQIHNKVAEILLQNTHIARPRKMCMRMQKGRGRGAGVEAQLEWMRDLRIDHGQQA